MSNESRITDYGSPITHHGLPQSLHNNPELERVERNPFASKSLYKTFKKSFIKNASRKNASLIECLESLYQITYPNYDVIVVDNGSEDESIEKIKDYAEGKIKGGERYEKNRQGI